MDLPHVRRLCQRLKRLNRLIEITQCDPNPNTQWPWEFQYITPKVVGWRTGSESARVSGETEIRINDVPMLLWTRPVIETQYSFYQRHYGCQYMDLIYRPLGQGHV